MARKVRFLSEEDRGKVIALAEEGYSLRQIGLRLKISAEGTRRIIQKKLETGTVQDKHRCGRPKVTTERDDRRLVRCCITNRRMTSAELKRDLAEGEGTAVSARTVRRRLQMAGLNGRIAARKPLVTKHASRRLKWAKERKQWGIPQWSKVLWSDESKFELFGSKRRVYVRRRKGERYHPKCVVPTVKHGGGSIMVWGCMSRDGVGSLHVIEGTLNATRYCQILRKALPGDGNRLCGRGFQFQQDGAPCHTARVTQAWFQKNKINVLPWVAQSADMNPIEHLWDELDRRVQEKKPRSLKELRDVLEREWMSIGKSITQKLVDSMPNRCRAVIDAKGGPTRY